MDDQAAGHSDKEKEDALADSANVRSDPIGVSQEHVNRNG